MFHRTPDFCKKGLRHNSQDFVTDESLSSSRAGGLAVHHTGGRAPPAPGAGASLSRSDPPGLPGGGGRRRPGGSLRERRVHLRQAPPAGNRPPGTLPAPAARGHGVVDQPPADPARVFFGAWVLLESPDGAQSRYRIVGPDEFDRAPTTSAWTRPSGAR